MIQPLVVTLFPVLFLAVLFGGGARLRRRNIDMDGEPPIHRTVFYLSKYAIVLVWISVILHSWGVDLSFMEIPPALRVASLCLWVLGFTLLLAGRFGMADSFRIGSAKESTSLRVNGLFGFSRNPMYVGVYATMLAAVLSTLNPVLLVVAILIVAVHHGIVLAEERCLLQTFGRQYEDYCCRVRRYL